LILSINFNKTGGLPGNEKSAKFVFYNDPGGSLSEGQTLDLPEKWAKFSGQTVFQMFAWVNYTYNIY